MSESATTAASSVESPTEPEAPSVARARGWLAALDFERPASSRSGAWLRVVAWGVTLVVLVSVVHATTRPLTTKRARAAMSGDLLDGHRYGMALDTRKEVFAELAKVEMAERKRAIERNTWNGHQWSREDDRGHYEMTSARSLASRYGVTLTQIYMVLDEGIRERWPGPDGEPLLPTTPPQDPRSTW